MRFLTPDEIPPTERKRRRQLEKSIKHCDKKIEQIWKHHAPELRRLVREGDYVGERFYRSRIHEEIERIREQKEYCRRQLPPFMEYEAGGFCI